MTHKERQPPSVERDSREAAGPGKETKIVKNGRAVTGAAHLTKMKAQYQTFKRVIVHFSGTRSCGDIND